MAADNAEAVAGFVAVARQRQAKRRRILADMRDMSEAVDDSRLSLSTAPVSPRGCTATRSRLHSEEGDIDVKVASVDELLRIESYAEQEARAVTARVRTLLETPSAKERSLSAKCVDITSVPCHRYADESLRQPPTIIPSLTGPSNATGTKHARQSHHQPFANSVPNSLQNNVARLEEAKKAVINCTIDPLSCGTRTCHWATVGALQCSGPDVGLSVCKFVHYEVDPEDRARLDQVARDLRLQTSKARMFGVGALPKVDGGAFKAAGPVPILNPFTVSHYKPATLEIDAIQTEYETTDMRTVPPQWIQCDVRQIDMSVLGKFSVIMADPPWDIHMDLPYGTMRDHEMLALPFRELSTTDGYIFLWVTARAMELGRECLQHWGYTFMQELLWIKTNQIQKVAVTGRTGHWLNHVKEHCLVGIKGNPTRPSRVLDCDVLVAEVRDTSHKPDEIYGLIERLSPGTRKLELFGRQHNVQKNWTTLGNQLDGIKLCEADVIDLFNSVYPGDIKDTLAKLNVPSSAR